MTQAYFAAKHFDEAKLWGLRAVQLTPKAPIRRALVIASCAYTNDLSGFDRHVKEVSAFAPNFIPNILSGELKLYKLPEHNQLLIDGLRKAGM